MPGRGGQPVWAGQPPHSITTYPEVTLLTREQCLNCALLSTDCLEACLKRMTTGSDILDAPCEKEHQLCPARWSPDTCCLTEPAQNRAACPAGRQWGCFSHSTSSDFLTIFFFSFLLFLIKLVAQLILFLWKTTWQWDPLPVVEKKKAKRGFTQQSEATGSKGPAHISLPHADWPLETSSALLNRGKSLPIFKLQEIPIPLQRGILGRKHLCA